MKKYTEYLQYSLWISDVKTKELGEGKNGRTKYDPECIRGIWNSSGSHGIFPVGVKRCTFEDYIDLITSGHSVKRVQKMGVESFSSRFLFIDLDNDNGENVTEDELEALKLITNSHIVFYPSTSGTPFRWHLYIETSNPMFVVKDLKRETFKIISELESVCKRKVTCDSKCYQNWHQVCYGMPQREHYKLSIPDGTEFFCHQILKPKDDRDPVIIRKFTEYVEFKRKSKEKELKELRIVPYNSKMLARALGIGELKDKPFSIYPPFTYKNRVKGDWHIREGNRYKTACNWILHLVPQWYKCNLKYEMGYSVEDLVHTLKCLCKSNFASFDTFDWNSAQRALFSKMNALEGKSWDEIEAESQAKIRTYRTQNYTWDLMMKLKDEFAYDDWTIAFRDRKQLREALKKYKVSIKTVKKYLHEEAGFDIVIQNEKRAERSDKGKTKFDFTRYPQNENGQYLIPSSEITSYVRNLASKMRIKIKSVREC